VRLSELLDQQLFKSASICVVGRYKTEAHEYLVLARSGQPVFPPPKIYHLILYTAENPDPELDPVEIASIKRRFKLEKDEIRT